MSQLVAVQLIRSSTSTVTTRTKQHLRPHAEVVCCISREAEPQSLLIMDAGVPGVDALPAIHYKRTFRPVLVSLQ